MQCDYCDKVFAESMNGLATKTLHEILHDPEEINS